MKYTYTTKGTCSRLINLDVENGVINDVSFVGGCHGNLQGISALVKGMKVEEAISRLEGINCGSKGTSCLTSLPRLLNPPFDFGLRAFMALRLRGVCTLSGRPAEGQ